MRTLSAKASDIQRRWHLIDAEGKVLGRMASRVARVLIGKHRPNWTPHVDCGDFVVIVNATKVKLTGRKREQKEYFKYSDYPSGLKVTPLERMMEKHPGDVVRLAIRRMLPKSRLGRTMIRKLKVYGGPEHPHEAQRPTPLELS